MTRPRFTHEVHPRRLSESRLGGAFRRPSWIERLADNWRASPAFERCLVVAMVGVTVGTIIASLVIYFTGA